MTSKFGLLNAKDPVVRVGPREQRAEKKRYKFPISLRAPSWISEIGLSSANYGIIHLQIIQSNMKSSKHEKEVDTVIDELFR